MTGCGARVRSVTRAPRLLWGLADSKASLIRTSGLQPGRCLQLCELGDKWLAAQSIRASMKPERTLKDRKRLRHTAVLTAAWSEGMRRKARAPFRPGSESCSPGQRPERRFAVWPQGPA